MKIEDLMIGDWVQITHHHTPKPLIKVKQIDLNDFKDVLMQVYPEITFEPIPLTREILEKNGFGFCDVHEGYYCQHGSVWTGWWIYKDLELAVTDYEAKWPVWLNIPDTNIKVEWVHQLQHALKQCGIEKEIKL